MNLVYNMMYGACEGEIAPKGHPLEVVKALGITYVWATPQTMTDQWWLWGCQNVPNPLPPFMRQLDQIFKPEDWMKPHKADEVNQITNGDETR